MVFPKHRVLGSLSNGAEAAAEVEVQTHRDLQQGAAAATSTQTILRGSSTENTMMPFQAHGPTKTGLNGAAPLATTTTTTTPKESSGLVAQTTTQSHQHHCPSLPLPCAKENDAVAAVAATITAVVSTNTLAVSLSLSKSNPFGEKRPDDTDLEIMPPPPPRPPRTLQRQQRLVVDYAEYNDGDDSQQAKAECNSSNQRAYREALAKYSDHFVTSRNDDEQSSIVAEQFIQCFVFIRKYRNGDVLRLNDAAADKVVRQALMDQAATMAPLRAAMVDDSQDCCHVMEKENQSLGGGQQYHQRQPESALLESIDTKTLDMKRSIPQTSAAAPSHAPSAASREVPLDLDDSPALVHASSNQSGNAAFAIAALVEDVPPPATAILAIPAVVEHVPTATATRAIPVVVPAQKTSACVDNIAATTTLNEDSAELPVEDSTQEPSSGNVVLEMPVEAKKKGKRPKKRKRLYTRQTTRRSAPRRRKLSSTTKERFRNEIIVIEGGFEELVFHTILPVAVSAAATAAPSAQASAAAASLFCIESKRETAKCSTTTDCAMKENESVEQAHHAVSGTQNRTEPRDAPQTGVGVNAPPADGKKPDNCQVAPTVALTATALKDARRRTTVPEGGRPNDRTDNVPMSSTLPNELASVAPTAAPAKYPARSVQTEKPPDKLVGSEPMPPTLANTAASSVAATAPACLSNSASNIGSVPPPVSNNSKPTKKLVVYCTSDKAILTKRGNMAYRQAIRSARADYSNADLQQQELIVDAIVNQFQFKQVAGAAAAPGEWAPVSADKIRPRIVRALAGPKVESKPKEHPPAKRATNSPMAMENGKDSIERRDALKTKRHSKEADISLLETSQRFSKKRRSSKDPTNQVTVRR